MRNYAEAVATMIREEHPAFYAEVMEIVKMNDETNIGVRVASKDNPNFAPVHYIEPFFKCGLSVEECVREIMNNDMSNINVELADEEKLNWEDIKDYITMRLVNVEYNKKFLADKVHVELGNGLAVMFDVTKGDFRAAITNTFAENIGCDCVMLVCASQISKTGTPVLFDLADRLFAEEPTNLLEGESVSGSSMFVLTSKDSGCGASVIYRSGVADKIRKLIGKYYLLPSSVDEWIVVPESANIPIVELSKMVSGANKTVVERNELLSYGVYEWTANGLERVA